MTATPTTTKPHFVGSRFFAKLLVVLVWASVAWVLSLLVHRLVLVVTVSPMPPLSASGAPSSDKLGKVRPVSPLEQAFGAVSATPVALKQADIQLVGLIEAGSASVVSVRIKNSPTRTLRMGQTDSDGWRLESVKNGEIELSRMGELYRLASYPSRNGLSLATDKD
jgi:hypothetical protein